MIYTVTCNPAVDYALTIPRFTPGALNRAENEAFFFGGKGINVSFVLRELGHESTALGFISGFTGRALREGIRKNGLLEDLIELPEEQGLTRINVKIKGREETEINGRGPVLLEENIAELLRKIASLEDMEALVLSGSLPPSSPEDLYERILSAVTEAAPVPVIVDAAGECLRKTLQRHPFLIKPNLQELSGILGKKFRAEKDILEGAEALQRLGARNVLVSRGKEGAVFLTEKGDVMRQAPGPREASSSVGAGDSMVAGFLAGYLETGDLRQAFRLGCAAGRAAAGAAWLPGKEEIRKQLAEE